MNFMGLMDFIEEKMPGGLSGCFTAGTSLIIGSILIGGCIYNYNPWSRRTMNPSGKQMQYQLPEDFKKMISVSSGGSEGDALITYESTDGKIISKEYNRMGLFETTIDWNEPNKK
jgi:hypothetical protein